MRKKLPALLLLLLAGGNHLFSQTPAADSLISLLRAHPQADTIKANLIYNLAREVRRNKPKEADSLIEIGLSLSEQLNYKTGTGKILIIKAIRYSDLSDNPSAYKSLTKAREILEPLNDKALLAYLYKTEANILMNDGKHALSLDDFLKGLKLAEEANDIKQVVEIEGTIGYLYNILNEYEKAIPYQTDALKRAQSIGYQYGISTSYNAIGKTYKTAGNYPASLDAYSKGLKIDEQNKDSVNVFISHSNLGDVYERMGNYPQSFFHIRQSVNFFKRTGMVKTMIPWNEWVLAKAFTHSGNADSGLYYAKHSLELSHQLGYRLYLREMTQVVAEAAAGLKQWDTAYKYQVLTSAYKDSLIGVEIARRTTMLQASFDLDKKQTEIELQKAENRREKNLLYAMLGGLALLIVLAVGLYRTNRNKQKANVLLQKQKGEIDAKAKELELLGEIGRKISSSLSVETIIGTVYDNVNSLMDASIFGIGIYDDEQKKIDFPATYEKGAALPRYFNSIYDQNRFAALCFISGKEIVMGDLETEYQNYLQTFPKPTEGDQPLSLIYLPLKVKDKMFGVITVQSFQKMAYTDYHLYMLRNISIYAAIALENAESFKKLNQTVDSLKTTQKQLIQSEKMASLGELTAGIAHEIQNPLNFVNNFSEINIELIEELKENIKSGNTNAAITLADDVKQNNEKITYHGKRADSIVKGMLQHSRSSSGQKQLTDINLLTDECLRLSYHGLRARDKSFNVKTEMDFDKDLPPINVASQDIGRVLLNLFTNAFYSVTQRQKQSNGNFDPLVSVKTKNEAGGVTITIKDNGLGIPQKVMDKIFQPFFTTKPAGEGTGLGLSMSYEIITKGHNGELKAETKEGEFAEFIIHLPNKP